MEKIKFEQAMERLEDILRSLEGGELALDEALGAYEEAVGLVKICSERLNEAQSRVRMLVKMNDGSISDAPFDAANEN